MPDEWIREAGLNGLHHAVGMRKSGLLRSHVLETGTPLSKKVCMLQTGLGPEGPALVHSRCSALFLGV